MQLNAAANHLRTSFVGPQLFYHKPIGVLLYLLPEHTCQVFNLFTGLTYQILTALNYGMTSLTAEALTCVRIQSTHGFKKNKQKKNIQFEGHSSSCTLWFVSIYLGSKR